MQNVGSERSLVPSESGIESVFDPEIENLIGLLSRPTHALTQGEYDDNMAKRQESVNKFLVRGSAETVRKLFERIRQLDEKQPIKIDLSMLEISGKILGGLYLPGANLSRLVIARSDISGGNLAGSDLTEAVATMTIMRGIVATGSNWDNAVMIRADLSGGRFVGCTFINTNMMNVIVDRETNFTGAVFLGTNLGRTDLSIANTTGAVFQGIRR